MKVALLSHPLNSATPTYGGLPNPARLESVSSIANGASANSYRMTLGNHVGTHVDCPAHFFERGRSAIDFAPGEWLFLKPQIIDVTLDPAQLLQPDAVSELRDDTDLLLLRSGWSGRRADIEYATVNPGIHPETAEELRRRHALRAIGLDWISVSSFTDRDAGRETHRILLDPTTEGTPLRLVEDMSIPSDLEGPFHVLVAPLLVEGIDSAPCTVFAIDVR